MKPRYDYPFLPTTDKYDDPSGVYFILNKTSNRMRIGQSLAVYARMMTHYAQLKSGIHTNRALQQDWNVFGEHSFEFCILVTIPDDFFLDDKTQHLLVLEQHFMRLYQTKNPIYGYDFDQRPVKPARKVYTGFFAHVSRFADQEIASVIGTAA
jgi:hypothetical protein